MVREYLSLLKLDRQNIFCNGLHCLTPLKKKKKNTNYLDHKPRNEKLKGF